MRKRVPARVWTLGWWALLVVGLVVLGGWWWRQPKTLQVVKVLPAGSMPLSSGESGCFAIRMSPTATPTTWYRWDGRPWWQTELPGFFSSLLSSWKPLQIDCSPDGRVLVLLMGDGTRARVLTWQEGYKTGDVVIPAMTANTTDHCLAVRNNGQVWMQFIDPDSSRLPLLRIQVSVVQDGRLLAHGQYTSRVKTMLPYSKHVLLSPNGSALVCQNTRATPQQWEYVSLGTSGRKVTFASRFVATSPTQGILSYGGLLLGADGALYGPTGKLRGADGWEVEITPHLTNTPGRPSTAHGLYVLQKNGGRYRVCNLRTHAAWRVPIRRTALAADMTPDGRYVITHERYRALSAGGERFLRLTERMPRVQQWFSQRLTYNEICIYQSPGKLRARLRRPAQDSNTGEGFPYVVLSPDGHRALCGVADSDGGALYQW